MSIGSAWMDSLFDLGADSVHLFQIVARANDAGIAMTPKQVLSGRSIRAIVAELERSEVEAVGITGTPQLVPVSRDRYRTQRSWLGAAELTDAEGTASMGRPTIDLPATQNGAIKPWQGEVFVFPATVGQQGFWYLDQIDPGNPAYNIAVRFRLEGPLQLRCARPCDQRDRPPPRVAQDRGPGHGRTSRSGGDARHSPIPVPVVDLAMSRRPSDTARSEVLTVEEARRRFSLSVGPLFRASLLRLDDQDHVLLVTVHHVISDGWSIGVFAR